MRFMTLGARASLVLASSLLPVSALAEPPHLRLGTFASEVTDAPDLQANILEERTRYGLEQATKGASQGQIVLLPAAEKEGADLVIAGKVVRADTKYRLTYVIQNTQQPRQQKALSYEFVNPRLSDKGVVVMAQELIAEGLKLEKEHREQAPAPVAAASESTGTSASTTPAPAAAPSEPVASAEPSPSQDAAPSEPVASAEPTPRQDSPAQPERPKGKGYTRLDIGASAGFNSPAGIYGGEIEYRLFPWLGLNASGGNGAWGPRVTPLVRLYPFSYAGFSPFLEAGTSFNFGGETYIEVNGVRDYTDMLLTPVATAGVGARISFGRIYAAPRVGWAHRLRQDNYKARDGGAVDGITETVLGLAQHHGFMFSMTVGASVF
jgi:hypothetical protein